jgi:3-deoxy-manno-octulosonate cytidylyltransferase (CMP-KDO synthetase)
MMDVIGVIPARFESSRFPGKVLANIAGRTMIQWVWEAASKSTLLEDLIIATDDERVIKAAETFGGKAVLTSKDYSSGTDRICEVVNPLDVKVIINIQADEPLINSSMIDELARTLLEDNSIQAATLRYRIEDSDELNDPNVVKVVSDKDGFALYFSRSLIPCNLSSAVQQIYKHIGMYAYTKDFLFTFANLTPSFLEQAENLEQLRALEHGYKIKVIDAGCDSISVDTPRDLEKVREKLR